MRNSSQKSLSASLLIPLKEKLMKKIVTLVFLMLVVSPASSAQDGLKGLKDYLKSVKYTVFVPPRKNVTLNTVVNYERGYESVVTSRCIPIDRVPPSSLAPVALT